MYNIAILAPPPCPDDPLLLGCQEMISQVRGAWKDGFRYKYVSAEMKKKSRIQGYHTAHIISLCNYRAFCLPFHSPLNSTVSAMGDMCSCGLRRMEGPSSGTTAEVDNEAGNSSSNETTRESYKLEQEKASWSATERGNFTKGLHGVAGHFLLLVGGRQRPLLEMKKQLAP